MAYQDRAVCGMALRGGYQRDDCLASTLQGRCQGSERACKYDRYWDDPGGMERERVRWHDGHKGWRSSQTANSIRQDITALVKGKNSV